MSEAHNAPGFPDGPPLPGSPLWPWPHKNAALQAHQAEQRAGTRFVLDSGGNSAGALAEFAVLQQPRRAITDLLAATLEATAANAAVHLFPVPIRFPGDTEDTALFTVRQGPPPPDLAAQFQIQLGHMSDEALRKSAMRFFSGDARRDLRDGTLDPKAYLRRAPYILPRAGEANFNAARLAFGYIWDHPERAALLRQVLDAAGDERQVVLDAFLACAEDPAMGDVIVKLAQQGPSPALQDYGKAVADIIGESLKIRTICAAVKAQPVPLSSIRDTVLRTAKQILLEADGKAASGPKRRLDPLRSGARSRLFHALQIVRAPAFSAIDPEAIDGLQLERFEPAGAVWENATILAPIVEMIRRNFPAGDDMDFTNRFLADPQAELFTLLSQDPGIDELVACVGLEKTENGPGYIDWLCANDEAILQGFAENLLSRALRANVHQGTFHAVKPHSPVLDMLMRHGTVCYGVTGQEEHDRSMYKHTYLKTRLLQQEQGAYHTQQFTDDELLQAVHADDFPIHQLVKRTVYGKEVLVARIRIRSSTKENLTPQDEQGWIFRTILEQQKEGLVVSRAVNAAPENRVTRFHYYFFEPDALKDEGKEKLRRAERDIARRHAS